MSRGAAERLRETLAPCRRLFVFTGAGISTPSGIPDFRGPKGVWTRRQPVYYQDFLASEDARIAYWDYKLEGWPAFRAARPNPVHRAITVLEEAHRVELVLTQNTDGLHRRAGTSEERLVEMHGSNDRVSCQECGRIEDPAPHYEAFEATGRAPCCPCGGPLKHTTISFGQSLLEADLNRAASAATACDGVLALGSTLSVQPAASFPLEAALRGVPYAIVNRGPTDHDGLAGVTLRLDGELLDIVPRAVDLLLAD